jgi:hypothetical protein
MLIDHYSYIKETFKAMDNCLSLENSGMDMDTYLREYKTILIKSNRQTGKTMSALKIFNSLNNAVLLVRSQRIYKKENLEAFKLLTGITLTKKQLDNIVNVKTYIKDLKGTDPKLFNGKVFIFDDINVINANVYNDILTKTLAADVSNVDVKILSIN